MQVWTLGRMPPPPILVSDLGSFPVHLLESHWLQGPRLVCVYGPTPFFSTILS